MGNSKENQVGGIGYIDRYRHKDERYEEETKEGIERIYTRLKRRGISEQMYKILEGAVRTLSRLELVCFGRNRNRNFGLGSVSAETETET